MELHANSPLFVDVTDRRLAPSVPLRKLGIPTVWAVAA